MQIAKFVWRAELGPVPVVLRQQDAEVVIADIGRKIIADNAINALVGFSINDVRFQDFNQRKSIIPAFSTNIHFDGYDFELDRIAVAFRVIPMRQCVETIVDHPQGIAQVLLTVLSPSQIGEVGRNTRVF
ncbi:hypothetical protein SY94_3826 [Agrobacterium tumefaciens]|nr:hypothetical protein SY94_3826 [Agrobacterium tumefaciens]